MHRGLGEGASAARGRGKLGAKEESDVRERERDRLFCCLHALHFIALPDQALLPFSLVLMHWRLSPLPR
jgi:hypothetical protein